MKWIFNLLFLLLVPTIYAQIIHNDHAQCFTKKPFFNTDYIYKNGIKRIEGNLSVMAQSDRMRKRGQQIMFLFNRNGFLTGRLKIDQEDTSAIYYKYDSKGRLKMMSESDRNGFTSDYYSYNQKGLILKKATYREKNGANSFFKFRPKSAQKVALETYEYRIDSAQKTHYITVYNKEERPYKKITKNFNEYGYLLSKETRYLVGGGFKKNQYSYNNHGLIAKIKRSVKIVNTNTYVYKYSYDDQQNLMSKHTYKNDKLKRKEEAVYDWESYQLEALINNDVNLKFMKIYQMDIFFY